MAELVDDSTAIRRNHQASVMTVLQWVDVARRHDTDGVTNVHDWSSATYVVMVNGVTMVNGVVHRMMDDTLDSTAPAMPGRSRINDEAQRRNHCQAHN